MGVGRGELRERWSGGGDGAEEATESESDRENRGGVRSGG